MSKGRIFGLSVLTTLLSVFADLSVFSSCYGGSFSTTHGGVPLAYFSFSDVLETDLFGFLIFFLLDILFWFFVIFLLQKVFIKYKLKHPQIESIAIVFLFLAILVGMKFIVPSCASLPLPSI